MRVCKKQAFSHMASGSMNWFSYLEMQLDENATKL